MRGKQRKAVGKFLRTSGNVVEDRVVTLSNLCKRTCCNDGVAYGGIGISGSGQKKQASDAQQHKGNATDGTHPEGLITSSS